MYTDGLVEARERSLDAGITELIDVLRGEPSIDLHTLVAKMKVSDMYRDDICVLAVTAVVPEDGGLARSALPGT